MKKTLIGLVALGGLSLVGGLATNAAADTRLDRYGRYDRIDQRQHVQEEQIRRGLAAGRLTRGEYRVLMREQNQIAQLETRAEADGRLTGWERNRIERAQDDAARNIQHLVRNDDYRSGRYGYNGR
jgi:hypothetical protein